MKAYIASSIRNVDMVKKLTNDLESNRIDITYKWFKHGAITDVTQLPHIAELEINGVLDADVLIALLPGGWGTHVELGIAIGAGKKIILHPYDDSAWFADNKRCVFHYADRIKLINDFHEIVPEVLTYKEQMDDR